MITGQMIAMAIMFMVTVGVASLLLVPATAYAPKKKTIRFYWCGFWAFLAVIAGTAGGSSTLMILGLENEAFSNKVFAGLLGSYVAFVVIGWCHICGSVLLSALKKSRAAVPAEA